MLGGTSLARSQLLLKTCQRNTRQLHAILPAARRAPSGASRYDSYRLQPKGMILHCQPSPEEHLLAVPFLEGVRHAVPNPQQVVEHARAWISAQSEDRLDFYSTQEEAVPISPGR